MTHTSANIVNRFFVALDILIDRGEYQSYYHFAMVHGFDRANLMRSKKEPATKRFDMFWITPLVTKHGLDGIWLFANIGTPFNGTRIVKRVAV